jgi:hypothetical protein
MPAVAEPIGAIGVLYEHPEWFRPLFAELDRRDLPYVRIDASEHRFDPSAREAPYSLLVNRVSASSYLRGHAAAIFHAREYLGHLEALGVPIVNGFRAYALDTSKARQLTLRTTLGLPHPCSRVVNQVGQIGPAAAELAYPIVVKPNIGGSGAGIVSYASAEELAAARPDPGLDGTVLVQEQLTAEGDAIVRVEILDGELLYAIRILLLPGSFNLCPADYCELPGIADGVSGRGLPIEAYQPPDDVIEDAKRIVAAAGMELGGVEYLVNERDGLPYFYDVNALSNFVADAPRVIGFDPFVDLVDFLLERAGMVAAIAR